MSQQGRHGESYFEALCTAPDGKAVAVVNPAVNDEHGWDRIVEIALAEQSNRPADLHTPVLTCYAQINTMRGDKRTTTVKLSNAVKAARSPSPSFVFLLHHQADGKPVLYERHIWEAEIERTLRRAREAGLAHLRKKTLTISFEDEDRITTAPPDWILRTIPTTNGMAYANAKRTLVDTVGYGDERWTGTFTIGPMDSVDDIVLHEIGILEALPFAKFRMRDRRFGIEVEDPTMAIEEGRISMTLEGRPLTLRLTSEAGETFDAPAHSWAPISVAPGEPGFRIRVKCGPIDLVLGGDGPQPMSLHIDWADRCTLIELAALLNLLVWGSFGPPVGITLETDICHLMSGSLAIEDKMETWLPQAQQCAAFALDALGRERAGRTELSFGEFATAMRVLHTVAAIHTSGSVRMQGIFEGDLPKFGRLAFYS